MKLILCLPEMVLLDVDGITQVVAETLSGSMGILPRRLDCVAALVPGILMYDTAHEKRHYVAVDEGILVKADEQVQISVRNAVKGDNLQQLQTELVAMQSRRDADDREARVALARMESAFIRRLMGFRQIMGRHNG